MKGVSTAFLENGYLGKMWKAQASSSKSRWGMESGKDFLAEGRGVGGLGRLDELLGVHWVWNADVQCWGVWNYILGKEALFNQNGFESETRVFYSKGHWGHSEGFLYQGKKWSDIHKVPLQNSLKRPNYRSEVYLMSSKLEQRSWGIWRGVPCHVCKLDVCTPTMLWYSVQRTNVVKQNPVLPDRQKQPPFWISPEKTGELIFWKMFCKLLHYK